MFNPSTFVSEIVRLASLEGTLKSSDVEMNDFDVSAKAVPANECRETIFRLTDVTILPMS
jgi:hypothetical protein